MGLTKKQLFSAVALFSIILVLTNAVFVRAPLSLRCIERLHIAEGGSPPGGQFESAHHLESKSTTWISPRGPHLRVENGSVELCSPDGETLSHVQMGDL